MTTQEIKDLIASKIAGQGSAVDAGSALPEILNGIVDAIAAIPEPAPVPEGLEADITGWQFGQMGEHSLTNEETVLLKNAVRIKLRNDLFLRQSIVSNEFISSILEFDEVRYWQPNQIVAVFSNFRVDVSSGNAYGSFGYYYVWILDGNDENILIEVDAN